MITPIKENGFKIIQVMLLQHKTNQNTYWVHTGVYK